MRHGSLGGNWDPHGMAVYRAIGVSETWQSREELGSMRHGSLGSNCGP